ncbi:NADPH-dependent FMN reductase [Salinarimonas ramus]|uniref:FMN reductase n=1 Tax=Salinarimonas ramus TaxID=690164 RepID=A0A917V2W2_9HYPH|nr:NAD(P)H-dependent oxidoreductase [Salinarimonas ramus]GGK26150.1 FMN reductase [Salinarimonas ramus]
MAADPLQILVLYGSVRTQRRGIGLARLLVRAIEARGHGARLADAAEIPLPLLDRMYKEYAPGEAPEPMERLAGMIRSADAVVVVSGEYNHGIPPALKNMLDHYLEEWFFKPAGIACYSAGRYGGVRAAMQLRMTLAELGMPTISTLLPVPQVQDAVTPEGEDRTPFLAKAMDKFLADLAFWAEAARARKSEAGTPY